MASPPTTSTPCHGCGRTAADCPPDEREMWFPITDAKGNLRWYCHHHNVSPEMQARQKIALRYHDGA